MLWQGSPQIGPRYFHVGSAFLAIGLGKLHMPLEYADPQKAIDNILARNPHPEAHTIPLNLRGMVCACDYEASVLHSIGFWLKRHPQIAGAVKQGVPELGTP